MNIRFARTAAFIVFSIGFAATPSSSQIYTAQGDSTSSNVQFDVNRSVACQIVHIPDVSTANVAALQPDEKLIQARISVSLLTYRGQSEQIDECVYRFESASSAMQVIDYSPRTTLDTNVAGNIRVQRNNESSHQASLNVNAGFDLVQANGGGSQSTSSRSELEYELAPPQEIVAAVGTTGRGTGVYFKLRRTPQTSLEGSRDFLITMRTPAGWRGGYFRAYFQAIQHSQRGTHVVGANTFVVPLYLAGDLEAKQLADGLSDSEQRLYAMARKNEREVRRRSQPTIVHELSLVDPKIPSTWLQQVLESRVSTGDGFAFESRLPAELKASIDEYRAARFGLTQLRDVSQEYVMTRSPATVVSKPIATGDYSVDNSVVTTLVDDNVAGEVPYPERTFDRRANDALPNAGDISRPVPGDEPSFVGMDLWRARAE